MAGIKKKHVIIGTIGLVVLASVLSSFTNFGISIAEQNLPLGATRGINTASLISLCLTASCEPYYNPNQPANSANNIQASIAFSQGLSTCSACTYNSSPVTTTTTTPTSAPTPVTGNTVVTSTATPTIQNTVNTTPAPTPTSSTNSNSYGNGAISCSIDNSYQLISTKGDAYSVSNQGSLFTALFDYSLIESATGEVLDHVNLNVYLYCANPPPAYAPYAPYLQSGAISEQFQARDSSGVLRNIGSATLSNVNSISSPLSGRSVEIASFSIPASTISTVTGNSIAYMTELNAVTSGTLVFSLTPNNIGGLGTAQFTPVISSMGITVQPSTPAPTTTNTGATIDPTQAITLTNLSNNNLDLSKTSQLNYQITVNDWSGTQSPPAISLLKAQTNTVLGQFSVISNPTTSSLGNGHTQSTWTGSVNVYSYIGSSGCYSLQLQAPSPTIEGGVQRSAQTVSFCTINYPQSQVNQNPSPSTQPNPVSGGAVSGNTYFLYTINYVGGTSPTTGTISSSNPFQGIVNLVPASLFASNGQQVQAVMATPTIVFPSGLGTPTFSNVNINQYYTVTAGNLVIQNTPSVVSSISYQGNSVGQLPTITFTPSQIDTVLSNANQKLAQAAGASSTPSQSQTPITIPPGTAVNVNLVYNGTFRVTNSATNAQYTATLQPMTFVASFTYQPTPIQNPQCVLINPANPPAGCANTLNNNLPINSTGGACIGLTPSQCIAKIDAANNLPNNDGTCNSSSTTTTCQISFNNGTVSTIPLCTNSAGVIIACQTSSQSQNQQPGPQNPKTTQFPLNSTQAATEQNACQQLGDTWNVLTQTCSAPSLGGGSPGGSTSGVSLCPAGETQQQCLNDLASQLSNLITIPVLNQNTIIIAIGGAAVLGAVIYAYRKLKK